MGRGAAEPEKARRRGGKAAPAIGFPYRRTGEGKAPGNPEPESQRVEPKSRAPVAPGRNIWGGLDARGRDGGLFLGLFQTGREERQSDVVPDQSAKGKRM